MLQMFAFHHTEINIDHHQGYKLLKAVLWFLVDAEILVDDSNVVYDGKLEYDVRVVVFILLIVENKLVQAFCSKEMMIAVRCTIIGCQQLMRESTIEDEDLGDDAGIHDDASWQEDPMLVDELIFHGLVRRSVVVVLIEYELIDSRIIVVLLGCYLGCRMLMMLLEPFQRSAGTEDCIIEKLAFQ